MKSILRIGYLWATLALTLWFGTATVWAEDLLVANPGSGNILRYAEGTGTPLGEFVPAESGGLDHEHWGITFGPDGNLYVANYTTSSVLRFNGTTGDFIDEFVTPGSGGLGAPVGLTFGADGYLYVASNGGEAGPSVIRYNGLTGEPYDIPVPSSTPDLGYPQDLVFGLDGKLYISTYGSNAVVRYDPESEFIDTFVEPGDGGLSSARQMDFGPDGNLYVCSQDTASIKRYSGATGDYIDDFVEPGDGGLANPLGMAFGPDGNLYVVSFFPISIKRYDSITGVYVDDFVPDSVGGITDCHYLVFDLGRTEPGTNVEVTPSSATTLTFDNISSPGITTVTPLYETAVLPANFELATSTGGFPTYFDISTTATFSGSVRLTVAYDATQFPYNPLTDTWPNGKPLLLHYGEIYTDLNQNHQYDSGESFIDDNSNGVYDSGEFFNDVNADGVRDGGEPFEDSNGNGVYDATTWVNLPNQNPNPVTHTVSADTTVFSPFAIVRRLAYSWSGVLQPINADGSSVFKKGSTIPVKFRLTGVDAAITNLPAKLYVAQVDSVAPVATNEAVSTSAADAGNTFRYDASSGQYVFNLSTKTMAQGTWYLRIDLGDGGDHIVQIQLKK